MNSSKSILFFPINGQGLGHLNRCLAYARHLPKSWRISFFSLSPIIEPLLKMGYEVEYFLSYFWTKNSAYFWNHELAIRLGLVLEYVKPNILLFDGTFPYSGLQWALHKYKDPLSVIWSRRGLGKVSQKDLSVNEKIFDLILQPGELDSSLSPCPNCETPVINTPPVTLFDKEDLIPQKEARECLGLRPEGKYILLSLASGNYKNINELGLFFIKEVQSFGYTPVWLQSPLSIKPIEPPEGTIEFSIYPISQYIKAFDGLISAAGYNTCYEAALAGLPTLFIPNDKLSDGQRERAQILIEHKLGVLCEKEDTAHLKEKCRAFMDLARKEGHSSLHFPNGAKTASAVIRKLLVKYKFK